MILGHRFTDLEEVLLPTTIVVVDQEAASIPVVLRAIKHLELDEGCLTSLHCCVVLILRTVLLFGDMLNHRQILNGSPILASEKAGEPASPVSLLIYLGQLDIVLEAHCVLLHLLLKLLLLMLLALMSVFSVRVIVRLVECRCWIVVLKLNQFFLFRFRLDLGVLNLHVDI